MCFSVHARIQFKEREKYFIEMKKKTQKCRPDGIDLATYSVCGKGKKERG